MQEKDLKILEVESENRKMKVELEEFRTEATHLKNQQATIRRLEERTRQLEQQVTDYLCFSTALHFTFQILDFDISYFLFKSTICNFDTKTV